MQIEQRLNDLGITLPRGRRADRAATSTPSASAICCISPASSPPEIDGKMPRGKLGAGMSVDEGYQHARQVGLMLIAAMRDALGGDLDRVEDIVKVFGMVNAAPDFEDHPKVVNGCSDLFVEVFGEHGRHARSAVGMSSLPGGIPVEIEAIVAIK